MIGRSRQLPHMRWWRIWPRTGLSRLLLVLLPLETHMGRNLCSRGASFLMRYRRHCCLGMTVHLRNHGRWTRIISVLLAEIYDPAVSSLLVLDSKFLEASISAMVHPCLQPILFHLWRSYPPHFARAIMTVSHHRRNQVHCYQPRLAAIP